MTKLIAAVMVLAVLYGGWELFFYWEKVKNEEEKQKKQAGAAAIDPDQLPGMPQPLQPALNAAESQGAAGLRNFLKTYSRSLQDPKKAWIELDLCLLLSREDPSEARRMFAQIKERTPETSPVWPRIKKLEKAYE
jgi:hypothetical protein